MVLLLYAQISFLSAWSLLTIGRCIQSMKYFGLIHSYLYCGEQLTLKRENHGTQFVGIEKLEGL